MDTAHTQFDFTSCPKSGQGCHKWLFYISCKAVDEGLTDEEAEPLIRKAMTRAPTPPSEIMDALRSARREERVPSMVWNPRNETAIKEIVGKDLLPGLNKYQNFEPLSRLPQPEMWIDQLFPGNPLLCIGKTSSLFRTKPREEWRGLEKFNSLIVPSPMTAVKGRTKAGTLSEHSLDNTGPRRYLILEFDQGPELDQLKLIFHLADYGPLVLICRSGGKSLHAWFRAKDEEDLKLITFMQYGVSLGADPRTWLASQFVRLPDGTRFENKNPQSVIYYDPEQLPQ